MTGEELNAAIQHHVIPIGGPVHLHLHGQISVEGAVSAYVRTSPDPSPLGIVVAIEDRPNGDDLIVDRRTLFVPRSSIIAIEPLVSAE